ncbi:MAG TPA: hypothetical protein VJU80_16360 [Solirubrobacteraceae bacterium]|nr:hypothetical protein [Solirubrobacteraceae bacterium]
MRACRVRALAAGAAIILSLAAVAGIAPSASASAGQVSIIQDPSGQLADPSDTLATFRAFGVNMVRVIVVWAQIAPDWDGRTPPRAFDASDPGTYPSVNWAPYDAIVRQAAADGIGVDFTLSGGAPRWAEGPGIPRAALDNPYWAWRPSASAFGQFVRAVGERYSGTYVPRGQTDPLPRVRFWAIWNEPNFGEDLGPQAIKGSTVSVAPGMYRNLVGQAWSALQTTGHGHDTILIGEFAPRGMSARGTRKRPQGLPGQFAQTKPLQFLRTLYCVDSDYRELRGGAARAVGCPSTAAGSRRFRRSNPGLFRASGLADHPYPDNQPPTVETSRDPDIAPFPRLANLEHAIDRVQRVYGSHRRLPIYNTEYGYITHPPNRGKFVSPATAAYYLNWAEYLSWRQPRIASTMQYLLADPSFHGAFAGDGGFASGLEFANGRAKPSYGAYRLPLYLPATTGRRGRALEVWGCVRPSRYAIFDTGRPQTAQIQFARSPSRRFTTVRTITLTDPDNCYFDVRLRFPGSGLVRLAYTYPSPPLVSSAADSPLAGTTVTGRTVRVTIH